MNNIPQIPPDQYKFTISEFAEYNNVSTEAIRLMIWRKTLPQGFIVHEISPRKRVILRTEPEIEEKPEYKNPSKLTPQEVIRITKCLSDDGYFKPNGKPNKRKIAETCKIHYDTLNRYLTGSYKSPDQNRSDKGKSRKLDKSDIVEAKKAFTTLLLSNVQRNVKLTIEKVEMNTGIIIPQRLAYKWAKELSHTHLQKHYMAKYLGTKTPHIIRDLWGEYPEFLSCVVADEWKIDEKGVWIHWKEENYDKIEAMAYIVMFIDMKTRYPVSMQITHTSITTNDTIKAAMTLVRDYGRPKQWIFENQKTWDNKEFLRFILGLYDGELLAPSLNPVEFMDLDQLKAVEMTNDKIIRTTPNHPQGKPIERTFRIIKDEFCAYSPSYSPNQFESRKPELGMAHPGVHRTFEQLRSDLIGFMENDYLDRKRTMFHNRMLSPAHKTNKSRPQTIREAFELAYQTFEADRIDELRLAYLYGEKYKAKYKQGAITFTYRPNMEKLNYLPADPSKLFEYEGQQLVALVDQYDIYKGWLFSQDGKLLCEAKDHRKYGSTSRERANEFGKIKREQVKLNRKIIKNADKLKEMGDVKLFEYEKNRPETNPEKLKQKTVSEPVPAQKEEYNAIDNAIFNTSIIQFNNN